MKNNHTDTVSNIFRGKLISGVKAACEDWTVAEVSLLTRIYRGSQKSCLDNAGYRKFKPKFNAVRLNFPLDMTKKR